MSRQNRNTPRLLARSNGCVFSAIEARNVGYTMAVPQPRSARSRAKETKLPAIAKPNKASPCKIIPHSKRSFLQTQSESRPLNNCPMPQTAGYTAAKMPISCNEKPFWSSKMGSSPHTMPSFRLLTRPVTVTEPRLRCRQLVSRNICSRRGTLLVTASAATWACVSFTNSSVVTKPSTDKPTPR